MFAAFSNLKIFDPAMRNLQIVEASKYVNEPLPLKSSIYQNGSSVYSNLKNLVLKREISLHSIPSQNCGVLPEIQAYWFCSQQNTQNSSYDLNLCRYDLNSVEVLSNFTTSIRFVQTFKPIKGIFNAKIGKCLFIVTDGDAFIYGIENDTNNIINTDFSAKLTSYATCLEINKGSIFIGCEDGNVYQAIYKSIDILNYKFLNLYSPGSGIIKTITGIFKRKSSKILGISLGDRFLVALLSNKVEVYKINGYIYKVNSIKVENSYLSIQILEEDPLCFYCVDVNGVRDFYAEKKIFSLDPPIPLSFEPFGSKRHSWSTSSHLLATKHIHDKSLLVFSSFNENQLRNFCKSNSVENYELISIYQTIYAISLADSHLYILLANKLVIYSILNAKKFLLNCRTEEIYMIYKNYGEKEFMIKYFELLTENEDVTKLEGLCKNDNAKIYYLFIWIYKLISPIWKIDISCIHASSAHPDLSGKASECDFFTLAEQIIKKLKILRSKLGYNYQPACDFLDEFVQTYFYCSLLSDYGIPYSETFETILTKETDFKNATLKCLLDLFAFNQSIEPLIKTMQNSCPLYLPLEHINMQRGLQLIKNDDKDSLVKSLDYLSNARFDISVVQRFNSLKFYYGSVFLIRKYFNFNYETAVDLFKASVRCKAALEHALTDSRESFLYPLFEAVISNSELEESSCKCCDSKDRTIDLVKIEHPVFVTFLKDRQSKSDSSSEKIYNLYWKYLLYRNRKVEAVEALLSICQRSEVSLEQKAEFLQTALSISTGTHLNPEVKMRLKLYEIQQELMRRVPAMRTPNLLDYNTLFNDYTYNHPDLSLKVLDAVMCKDDKLYREIYQKLFSTKNVRDCILLIKDLSNKDISLVTSFLVESSPEDICNLLEQAGFSYEEIIQAIKSALHSTSKPETKIQLLKSLRKFSKFSEFKECEAFCERSFGIKIYK